MEFSFLTLLVGLIPALFFLLLPAAAVIALQVWLCRRESKWLGLILPALTLLLSLVICLSAAVMTEMVTVGSTMILPDGTTVVGPTESQMDPMSGGFLTVAVLFLAFNVPTAVLLAIWLFTRSRRDLRDELRRMKAQDLE